MQRSGEPGRHGLSHHLGAEQKDLSPFVGKKVRLHIQADNATSLFSYRFGPVVS